MPTFFFLQLILGQCIFLQQPRYFPYHLIPHYRAQTRIINALFTFRHLPSDYMIISILPFGVNKTEQVSSGQFQPKTLEYQAQIEYYMELQDIACEGRM